MLLDHLWNGDVHHMFTNPLRKTLQRNNLGVLDNSSITCEMGISITCTAVRGCCSWERVERVLARGSVMICLCVDSVVVGGGREGAGS